MQRSNKDEMFYFENLPNELLLTIFSYFTKLELFQSYLQLNLRLTHLLVKYVYHINLSSKLSNDDANRLLTNYFPSIQNLICSLTIDHQEIGKNFLEKSKTIPLENLFSLQLIDDGIDLNEDLLKRYQPEILKLIQTPFHQQRKHQKFVLTSLKELQLDLHIEDSIENCLLNELDLSLTAILVDLRLSFSKLSSYIRLFTCLLTIPIEKLSLSIFSIDEEDLPDHSTIVLPFLIDFQLEICPISFHLLDSLLPLNMNNQLKRFAFTGQTTNKNAQSWRFLLDKYRSIQQFDLQLFSDTSIDCQEWKCEFPKYFFEFNSLKNFFRISSSKFDRLDRIYINECIQDLNHINYANKISHLILRSQYWCSYFDLSLKIQNDLFQRFHHIRRLSISYRQLKLFVQKNFLNQIEQLDLEFAEQYCLIENNIAEEFLRLKSIHISSMYDGIHQLNLHSTIKDILLNQFSQVNFISIDSITIIDDEQIQQSILQWYSSTIYPPIISYIQGKSFSVWF